MFPKPREKICREKEKSFQQVYSIPVNSKMQPRDEQSSLATVRVCQCSMQCLLSNTNDYGCCYKI